MIRFSFAAGWFYTFCVPLNSLVFLFHVYTVFQDHLWVKIAFGVLWLLTLFSFASPICGSSTNSSICELWMGLTEAPAMFAVTLYDTALFLAVNIRFAAITSPHNTKSFLRRFFTGNGMGHISRELLVTGQIYYL